MTLKDVRNSYDYFSGKLSDIVRQLSLAGVAVVWIFRKGNEGIVIESDLIVPLILFVGALGFDLLHYIYASAAWAIYAHRKEREGHSDSDTVSPHESINWVSLGCFWLKALSCVSGFLVLLKFLQTKL